MVYITFSESVDSKGCKKVSDLFIIVTTADRNLIYKNTANTSSLTRRGCMMIFEPETCLYVSSMPKP